MAPAGYTPTRRGQVELSLPLKIFFFIYVYVLCGWALRPARAASICDPSNMLGTGPKSSRGTYALLTSEPSLLT